ncbi:MAG: ferrous iron transporter B [Ignavibacteriota bacterium]|nr:MAG: ferrous iron transporter B [Chlorobiota bacterium]MBE7475529.1 ferrous iron transporter B [Ignavibacteriales bacterium]MBL1122489.1 ferrous iron transporter B [Ignavibacteriota bacterium]MCE7856566.1 ferrous iron transporter B [Ignavibacteria bacterium CHB3]MCL4278491.1 ferrous iron transporter B [Ignavibacteriaceae bacterium]
MLQENQNSDAILSTANNLRWEIGENFHDTLMESIYSNASTIVKRAVTLPEEKSSANWEKTLDRILTSRYTGFPIMFLLLGIVFWLTIQGANVPSGMIATFLIDTVHPILKSFSASIGLPFWLDGVLIDGAYLAMAWVISVMLPPMAIFFPLFTLLEDFGYLPRVSFNMDNLYKKVGAHGKQALTMAMGFGCNAAGIIATRVIDSPRERLIAIITNNFSLCNGRWPTQILIATIFIGAAAPAYLAGIVSAAAVVFIAVLGVVFSLIVSWALSKSVLKGEASAFSLELPPYRPPRILQTLYTSLIDRTIFVLWRAVVFAVPAGVVIWLVANINIGEQSIANIFIGWVNPFAFILGLNGVIFLAYIIAIPANEIVIPTILMLTVANLGLAGVGVGNGVMFELDSTADTAAVLQAGGWTMLTGINLMLFSLLHNPCSTTIYTIYKETKSIKWTLISTFLPIAMGLIVTFFVTQIWRIFTN